MENFRQYIQKKISQTKKDKRATYLDTKNGGKKGLDNYQKPYFDARLGLLKEIYEDCRKYEWGKRI